VIPHHCSFQHGVHVQFARNLRQRLLRAPVPHDGSSRNYSKRTNLRQRRDHFIGEAVGEIVLFGIVRKVLERQNSQRLDGLGSGRRQQAIPPPTGIQGHEGRTQQDQTCCSQQPAFSPRLQVRSRDRGFDRLHIHRRSRRTRFGRSSGRGYRVRSFQLGDKPIPAAGDGLDEFGLAGIVLQRIPDLADGFVDPVLEIDEGAVVPDFLPDGVARDQLSRLACQKLEQAQSLRRQFDGMPAAAQLFGFQIDLVARKPQHLRSRKSHRSKPLG